MAEDLGRLNIELSADESSIVDAYRKGGRAAAAEQLQAGGRAATAQPGVVAQAAGVVGGSGVPAARGGGGAGDEAVGGVAAGTIMARGGLGAAIRAHPVVAAVAGGLAGVAAAAKLTSSTLQGMATRVTEATESVRAFSPQLATALAESQVGAIERRIRLAGAAGGGLATLETFREGRREVLFELNAARARLDTLGATVGEVIKAGIEDLLLQLPQALGADDRSLTAVLIGMEQTMLGILALIPGMGEQVRKIREAADRRADTEDARQLSSNRRMLDILDNLAGGMIP